jgi:ribonuclease Z
LVFKVNHDYDCWLSFLICLIFLFISLPLVSYTLFLQLQVQRTSSIRPSKITKIFLTHAHGDHTFGLPGLLCLMGADNGSAKSSNTNLGDTAGDNNTSDRQQQQQAPKIVDIYGPEGLRMWLRVAIRYSVSRIVPLYRVHELKDIPMAPEWTFSRKHQRYYYNHTHWRKYSNRNINNDQDSNCDDNDSASCWGGDQQQPSIMNDGNSWMAQHDRMMNLEPSTMFGEVDGGRDIFPHYDHPLSSDGAPVWQVVEDDEGDVKVYAAPMSHGIPCVGYVVVEDDRPGRLRDELVRPICMRNLSALKETGFVHPLKAMAVIKDLPVGGCFTFPDGTVVSQEEAVEPPRPGRKVVICGDTASARALETLARGADVVVHEATNTCKFFCLLMMHSGTLIVCVGGVFVRKKYLGAVWVSHIDPLFMGFCNDVGIDLDWFDRDTNMKMVTKDAMIHGHSTPHMAGLFAKQVGAKRLIMNHFSARYLGDGSLESMQVMTRIEEQAVKASGLNRDSVAAAWDVSQVSVHNNNTNLERTMCLTGTPSHRCCCFSFLFFSCSPLTLSLFYYHYLVHDLSCTTWDWKTGG